MTPRPIGLLIAAAFSLLCTANGFANEATDPSVNSAKNLARLNVGAHIDRVLPGGVETVPMTGNGSDNSGELVLDDNTLSCPLPVGDSTFIISLPRISVLQRFAFVNPNGSAQGEFELAVSSYRIGSRDPKWTSVQAPMKFGGTRFVSMPILGVEAKYVKLTLHVRKQGRLAGIALYGSRTLESFADRHVLRAETNFSVAAMKLMTHPEDTLNFNFANRYARARIAYVSSGEAPVALRMIDDDVATSFNFAPDDAHPTVIIGLANRQNLHRISALYQMKEGVLEVYTLDELGSTPGDLSSGHLIATVKEQSEDGNTGVDFDPRGARFIALRWTPRKGSTVEVSEIAAFGSVPMAILDLEEEPETFAQTFTANAVATFASPPVIEVVSP